MTSLALKSLWARKRRAFSTTLAVVIGVGFVAGSYVLTDTIFAAFDEIFNESLKGTSVVVTAKNPVEQENGEVAEHQRLAAAADQKTPGVKLAAGAIFTPGGFFDAKTGDAIGAKFAPKFISSHLPDGLESLTYVDGHPPRGPTETSIDKAAADEAGLKLGERLEIVGQSSARDFRLVGFTQLGSASFGGTSIAQLTLPVAQAITHKVGRFDQISIAAEEGVSPAALKRRIAAQMPASVRVETAKESADRGSEEIRDNLGFLQTFLLVFAYIALFVGAFLIFNTFSITVAQRVSEFGMLRTLGASRRQILTTVIVEALAIGLLGALLGIGAGFLIALLLNALFVAFGIDLPTTGLVLETRTVVVSLLIGVLVTLRLLAGPGAALDPGAADRRPARRRPAPSRRRRIIYLVALRPARRRRLRPVLGGLFGGGDAGAAAGMVGGGALAIVLAVSIFSPRLVPPLANRLGLAAGAPAQADRPARPRERRSATRPHRGHRGGADDRPRPGRLRHRLRRRAEEHGRPGRRRKLRRRHHHPEQRRLLADPGRRRVAAEKVPGVESVATIRSAEAKLIGGGSTREVTAPTPDVDDAVKIEWKRGGPEALRDLARPRGGPLRLLRLRPRPGSGTACAC